jgi:hypothetical protein
MAKKRRKGRWWWWETHVYASETTEGGDLLLKRHAEVKSAVLCPVLDGVCIRLECIQHLQCILP